MFTIISRKEVLEKLVELLKEVPNIEGLVLVGSGADNSTDIYSDIDLVCVVSPQELTRDTWDMINDVVKQNFEIIIQNKNEFGEKYFNSVFFLNDYLQIDIGVTSYENLISDRGKWKIILDKNSRVGSKLENAWAERSLPEVNKVIEKNLNGVFSNVQNFCFAIKRNKFLRATKEIDEIREKALEIWGSANDKVIKHHREVDDMTADLKQKLFKTFPKSIMTNDLLNAYAYSIEFFFLVLDKANYPKENYSKIKNYIEDFSNSLFQ